jgi:hypothetical protein
MSNQDERFDGLFMSAIQQCQGIENFYSYLFSFMRRKTDFFTMEERSGEIVNKYLNENAELFKLDKVRQELIKNKQNELKNKHAQENTKKAPPKQEDSGATVEEIDDDEAKKIDEFEQLRKKQQEAKDAPKPVKKVKTGDEDEDGEEKEEENLKQKPNAGNGGQTEKYVWHQTLEEVTLFMPLPLGAKANMLDVKIGINDFKVSLKSKPSEPLIEGKWAKKINPGETFWNLEREGDKSTLNVTIEKHEGKSWWNSLLQGDIEIDTQKVEPENSKLSDLDGETRSTVEKMMFDQAQKAKGLPSSDEMGKKDKLAEFMKAHPEMDFSKAKFS